MPMCLSQIIGCGSPSFVLLRQFLDRSGAKLVVPKIVLEEVINHNKEDVERLQIEIRRALREGARVIRGFKDREDWIKLISKTAAEDPYADFVSTTLEQLNAEIPDYKEIPHSEIVRRDLKRRKPFQQSGKGYRDTLLWETVIRRCLVKDKLTVFVTENVRDFYGADQNLDRDLQLDVLRKAKGPPGT